MNQLLPAALPEIPAGSRKRGFSQVEIGKISSGDVLRGDARAEKLVAATR